MMVLVTASLAACAGAVFSVLNRSADRDRRRNAQVSVTLLILCAGLVVAWCVHAVAAWQSR